MSHRLIPIKVLFLLTASASTLLAEAKLPFLSTGLNPEHVKALWGEPTERIEKETRRVLVWKYPRGEVIFQGDKVSSWRLDDNSYGEKRKIEKSEVIPQSEKIAVTKEENLAAVISELVNELPNEETTGVGAPPPGAPMGIPPPPNYIQ